MRKLYLKGKKNAKEISKHIRLQKLRDVMFFDEWFKQEKDKLFALWKLAGRPYSFKFFSLELFKGNQEILDLIEIDK